MTRQGRAAVARFDDEFVAFRLAADGFVDGRVEQIVTFAVPEWRAQVGVVVLAQAHKQLARAGNPHPVAGGAEIMA